MTKTIRIILLMIPLMVTQIVGAGFQIADCTITEDVPLITAFETSECKVVSAKTDNWSSIGEDFLEIKELKAKALKATKILGLSEDDIKITKEIQHDHRLVKITGMLKNDIYIEIVLHSLQFPEELNIKPETFVLINTTEKGGFSESYMMIKKLEEAITTLGGIPQIYYCITGGRNGKLDDSIIEETINNIFESVSASRVDDIIEPVLSNAYGYSPLIEDHIMVMGHKVNLHVASRYSEYDDMTYIWVGTPIISGDY